jgi:PQQ-dependent catabolism-associated CXXCW motif protein
MMVARAAAAVVAIIALTTLACGGADGQQAGGEQSRGQGSSGVARPEEPAGYRTHDYRAPTPATLEGARVVTTAEAEALWRDNAAIFIDVLPRAPRPPNLPPGTVWRDRPRSDIPRSIWLPDTGYGDIAAATADYLRRNVERVAAGDPTKSLVVYCLRDCWMSWNAAKRLLAMGYLNVAWYPDGTDGWSEALLPLADAQPEPGQQP